jgi:mannonate dehydratase
MKIGLNLSGKLLTPDNLKFAVQAGATHIVAHLNKYDQGVDPNAWRAGGAVGPVMGDCSGDRLWTYDEMAALVQMVRAHGLELAALENFSPKFWSDILLDGPEKRAQMEGLKRLVRDAGRAGIPCIGYNFSIAGVWGWVRGPFARGGAMTVAFDMAKIDHQQPIPDGMVWNMRYRAARPDAPPIQVSDAELWERVAWFLKELVPVAEEAGVTLAAHGDDPPVDVLRGAARLVNQPWKYDRLLGIVDSPANGIELCLGTVQEMASGDLYESVRDFARRKRIGYIHFRNVRGKVPRYHEAFVDDGDIDMLRIVRILHEEGYDGVLVPDHAPDMTCPSPWHAGFAFTLGYMRALIKNIEAFGAADRTERRAVRN